MNPPLKTKFQQVLLDQQEHIYNSKRRAPLGSSHDQSPGLPKQLDPSEMSFGITTLKDESAGATVNPPKSTEEVDKEFAEGRELYKKVNYNNNVIATIMKSVSSLWLNQSAQFNVLHLILNMRGVLSSFTE